MALPISQLECDFTLALNNKTGKFFFCRELIGSSRDLIKTVRYWRLPLAEQPGGLFARILGRLARMEVDIRFKNPLSYKLLPTISPRRPVVFMDPRESILYSIKPRDVVLCHDMGPITHPDLYASGVHELYTLAFARISAVRPLMLFVSEASRLAFIRLYGDDFPLLQVVHIPLRHEMEEGDMRPVAGLPDRFLLTVGSIGVRKNQLRCIEAFALSGLGEEGHGYVLCGGREPGYEAAVAAAQHTAGVTLTGYVDDSELRWLYRHAEGFVLPSLLEGFGLPAAEAIRNGLIPLVSSGGALHEVTGEAAILVDPLRSEEIARGMRQLTEMDQNERNRRLTELRKHILRFSRENMTASWRSALRGAFA
jgi:glycosyltransferase involved in cell wall biosynthesis